MSAYCPALNRCEKTLRVEFTPFLILALRPIAVTLYFSRVLHALH